MAYGNLLWLILISSSVYSMEMTNEKEAFGFLAQLCPDLVRELFKYLPEYQRMHDGWSLLSEQLNQTKKEKKVLMINGHTSVITLLQFNHAGNQLISCDENSIRLWDTNNGQELFFLTHNNVINDVQFSADDSLIAIACENGNLGTIDLKTKLVKIYTIDIPVSRIKLSNDNTKLLAFSCFDFNNASLINLKTKIILWTMRCCDIPEIDNENKFILLKTFLRQTLLLNFEGKIEKEFNEISQFAGFSDDGTKIILSCCNVIKIYDKKSFELIKTFRNTKTHFFHVYFNEFQKRMITGSVISGITIIDLDDDLNIKSSKTISHKPSAQFFSYDVTKQKIATTVSDDLCFFIWDATTRYPLVRIPGILPLYNPNLTSNKIAMVEDKNILKIIDLADQELKKEIGNISSYQIIFKMIDAYNNYVHNETIKDFTNLPEKIKQLCLARKSL